MEHKYISNLPPSIQIKNGKIDPNDVKFVVPDYLKEMIEYYKDGGEFDLKIKKLLAEIYN